ncbi:MAG: molybdopterin converting factor subunit 1 [candidate division Zixibacteria bacterium]|nr:molybdopterin converting factor subunit 1 [candidate division Zixibacteria bacterium]
MHIHVRFFAGCKDAVGRTTLALDVTDGTTAAGAFDRLTGLYPALDRYRSSLRLAVNAEYVAASAVLRDGDELACIPPVSGGTDV